MKSLSIQDLEILEGGKNCLSGIFGGALLGIIAGAEVGAEVAKVAPAYALHAIVGGGVIGAIGGAFLGAAKSC